MTGDTRYIHVRRRAKWADLGIHVPTAAVAKDAPVVLEQLRNEVESLVDDDGNLLYSEVDLQETIEWIQLFKASKEQKTSAAAVRKWARANGHAVTAKGRVPTKLKVLYSLAHEN